MESGNGSKYLDEKGSKDRGSDDVTMYSFYLSEN